MLILQVDSRYPVDHVAVNPGELKIRKLCPNNPRRVPKEGKLVLIQL
jgi:hypothetical protein